MGRIVGAALFAVFMLGSAASAQDDEEEGGGDLDSLMSGDPEQPAKKADADEGGDAEQAGDDEKPGVSDDEIRMSDDERPPGDEHATEVEPKDKAADEAEAEDTGHPNPISLGVLAGYGINTGDEEANAWTFGFGVRGGYNLSAFYLGARFVYYIGETVTTVRFGPTGDMRSDELSANLWELGFEAGFDLDFGSVALRPGLGFGFASLSGTQTEANMYVAPGLTLFYEVTDTVYLGLDTRYQAVLATTTVSGVVLLANVGMRI